ncbi:hypothetical protein EGW08_004904 [Elysia chlorotica]|uniref:Uncharacterized protein n=1 Tax=Elysia chlorotica TaxID=188477 RepID=A0A3S1B3T7_ELYCH|nr:hypothetical protein EGW08_013036 [Elysia chlorotica]RUS87362.1 hypothetical protein EGW08_004904 [Elysia chlorotica]
MISTVFVSPFVLRPFGKAAPRKQTKRKSMSSAIYTSSPVKKMLEEQLMTKNKVKKLTKSAPYQDPDSDSDIDNFSIHDDSDTDISVDTDDDDQRGLQLEPVTQTIRKNDHVLVAFEQKGLTQYLVGIANEDEDSDGDIDVSFLRKSLKVDNKFVKPNVEDNGSVKKQNVHAILPPPVATGTTSRTKNGIVFDMDFSKIKLW